MSPRSSLPLTIEYALLGLLRPQPGYGYEIYRQLADPTGLGLVWRVKQSKVYALLDKLEQRGYVSQTLEPQESLPPRKMFALTELGRRAFLDWAQSPVDRGRGFRLDFLAKFYFARQEGDTVARTLLERQQAACRNWLAEQQILAEGLADSHPFDWLVHQFRISQIKAMLDWLNTCREL
ncbi:MAG: PadR family transcriptional regulator [Anaerolineae bacterium]|nr:PadR family transcriptional regulator [Anaerolineae bacterium]